MSEARFADARNRISRRTLLGAPQRSLSRWPFRLSACAMRNAASRGISRMNELEVPAVICTEAFIADLAHTNLWR